ncbi:MAG: OmpH family outer membrane protein [Prevotella sp.]|jgi:outer membrane protein
MKKVFLYLLLATISLQIQAQDMATSPQDPFTPVEQVPELRFGYFSYKAVFEASPDYIIAQQNIEDLRAKYDSEMKRVEEEFNKKYEDFLEGQNDFAPSILQKRQAELQEMMEKNMAFKQEAKRLLKQAEHESFKSLREKIAHAILSVGKEKGLAFIINTDNNAVPYINVTMGEDVTGAIAAAIK